MTTRAYRGYDVPGYIGALRREGELLAAAADRAGMGAGVPSCPDWAVRDLLKHTGYVHRWAAEFITRGLTRPEGGTSEAAILSQGPGDDRLPGWFREGHAALVQALGAADGVDELIMGFLARNINRGGWPGLDGSLAIHAADGPAGAADWLVAGGPGGRAVSRGSGPADCDVTGPAADLYLALWNRRPPDGLRVDGDPGILTAFASALQISW